MLKITEDQIKAAYEVAKRVYAGEISRAAGTRELVREVLISASCLVNVGPSVFVENWRSWIDRQLLA